MLETRLVDRWRVVVASPNDVLRTNWGKVRTFLLGCPVLGTGSSLAIWVLVVAVLMVVEVGGPF